VQRPISLALRLTLFFGIAAAIVWPLFGWVVIKTTETHFIEQDSEELEIIVSAVQDVLSDRPDPIDMRLFAQRLDDILVGHHDASLHIAGPDNRDLYASDNPMLGEIAYDASTHERTVWEWRGESESYRVLRRDIGDDGGAYHLMVAVPIDDHLRFLSDFRRTVWLMIAVCIALMGVTGWMAVRQGHAPLRSMVSRIRRISANELSTRLEPDAVPEELTDLATSFNGMLQRVDEAFHRLSDFNADIAHELRTPIANLMTQTQVGLSRARSADEYREMLYSNMEEYERMAQMVGDMLYLAQTDRREQLKELVTIDLGQEVRALFEFYEGWADERHVTLALSGGATVTGDRLMLQRALGNLVSNAIRHTPTGGTVRVSLSTAADGAVQVEVENPGDPIPPEHLPRLFHRFYRVDQSRQKGDEGAGLGLAIVKSIATAHGGNIGVESSIDATRFTLSLPPQSQ
jgi:two-component system, OmpR family, heavy metal sensor histidine kinase CusS